MVSRSQSRIVVPFLVGMLSLVGLGPALGETHLFAIDTSLICRNSDKDFFAEVYSMDRNSHWPDKKRRNGESEEDAEIGAFTIACSSASEFETIEINCKSGEKICINIYGDRTSYGWRPGWPTCEDCCAICQGSGTKHQPD